MTWISNHRTAIRRALLIGAAFALMLAIFRGRAPYQKQIFGSDAFGYYIYLPSLVIDGDIDLWNQLSAEPYQRGHDFYSVSPKTGYIGNGFQVGCSLLWSPLFLLVHGVISVLGWLGVEVRHDGFGFAHEFPMYCGAFAYGLVGVWYMKRFLEELWGPAIAKTVVVYMIFGTALAAYLWFDPILSHLLSATLITMYFYYLHHTYQTRDRSFLGWLRLGVLLGLIASVRVPDSIVMVAGAGVGLAICRNVPGGWWAWFKAVAKCGLILGLVSFVVFIPQMLTWKTLFGHYILVPANSNYDRTNWTDPHIWNYFFSLRRGLFLWTPIAIPCVIGLVLGVRRGPAIMPLALVVLLFAVYFNSSIYLWWIGDSFCDRRLVDYSIILALGLGYLFSLRPQWVSSYKVHLIGAVLIAFNWLLMLRYFTGDLAESAHYTWAQLYLDTFTFPAKFVDKFF